MKKSMRYMSFFLAGLMLLGVFGMLFAQLAYSTDIQVINDPPQAKADTAAEREKSSSSSGSSSGSSSSSSEPDNKLGGTLMLYDGPFFYKADTDGTAFNPTNPDRSIKKGPLYRVEMTVIDPDAFVANGNDINTSSAYVSSSTGSYFSTYKKNTDTFSDTEMTVIDVVGGSPKLKFVFYVRYDGKGKMMKLDVGYTYTGYTYIGEKETERQARGSFEMRINSAVLNPDAVDQTQDSYLVPTPNIIVTSYNYGNKDIMAGYDFPLTFTYENTSDVLELENIVVDIATTEFLSIANGSNSTFIKKLPKGDSQTKTLTIHASPSIEPKPQQITIKFSYEYILNKKREAGTREEKLAVPIVQLDRFSVGEMSVPQQIYPGDNTYISIDYVNKGKTEVPNLSARLESDTEGISDSQIVGNVKAGDSGTIEFQFTPTKPGAISGKIIVSYEDVRGVEKKVERPFSATVVDISMGTNNVVPEQPVVEEKTELTAATKLMAFGGGLLVAGITATVVIKKAKRKRDEEKDEDI